MSDNNPLWLQIVEKHGGHTAIGLAALEGRIPDEELRYLSATYYEFQMLRLIWERLKRIEEKIS